MVLAPLNLSQLWGFSFLVFPLSWLGGSGVLSQGAVFCLGFMAEFVLGPQIHYDLVHYTLLSHGLGDGAT